MYISPYWATHAHPFWATHAHHCITIELHTPIPIELHTPISFELHTPMSIELDTPIPIELHPLPSTFLEKPSPFWATSLTIELQTSHFSYKTSLMWMFNSANTNQMFPWKVLTVKNLFLTRRSWGSASRGQIILHLTFYVASSPLIPVSLSPPFQILPSPICRPLQTPIWQILQTHFVTLIYPILKNHHFVWPITALLHIPTFECEQ